ncbi:GFA family protein [Acinetobacter pragensis]|uniref:GFA family protein n=1 Tax=Acinetobacter pragensis TaxID=1806892 RepID=UPI00334292F2
MQFNSIHGSCQCEANTFTINAQPIARFNCHCKICQQYSGQNYSDVSVFLRSDVSNLNISSTQFKRFKLPPNIRRGLCKKCNKPSIELGMVGQLVFIPTANLKDPIQIEEPSMHIFYHRRVQDINDGLPKYSGFLISQTMVSMLLMQGTCKHVLGAKG